MRIVIGVLCTILLFSSPANAQNAPNYVMVNTSYASNGNTEWAAVVLSYKDKKVYECIASRTPKNNATINLTCNLQQFSTGTILTGSTVVNAPANHDVGQPPVITDFWQLDQNTGEVQLCTPVSFAPKCVKTQLP